MSPQILAMDEFLDEEKFERETIFDIEAKESQEQFEKFKEQQRDYSVWNQKLYENDYLRIYNHSLYQFDDAKNKMMAGQNENSNLQDLKLSFGYGMEFKLDKAHSVGYEYVSNFPYDRGQLIRIFWSKRF